MKTLKFMLACVAVLIMTACNGGGYDAKTCEQLKDKIQNRETFTEADYDDMVDQFVACAGAVKTKVDEAKGNQEKEDALRNDEEFTNMMGYALGFGFYLEQHKADLSDANIKKLDEAEKELKSLN